MCSASPFDPASVDRRRFTRRYAAGATYGELGAEFDLTEHQVTRAIRAFELPARQPGTRRPLSISDRQLASLVAAGYSDVDIARRYDVAVWAVVRRRRQGRLLRPPPNKVRPPVTRARLERQLAAGVSRAEIATAHRVGLATVTRWCAHYGLEVVGPPRPAGGRGVELDPRELRRLYVAEQWTARQIADEFGVDTALVNFALHSHRIPVRHGGHGTQDDAVVLLDALYADADVVAVAPAPRRPVAPSGRDVGPTIPAPGAARRRASPTSCTARSACRRSRSRCSPVTPPRTSSRCCAATASPAGPAADRRGTSAPSCERPPVDHRGQVVSDGRRSGRGRMNVVTCRHRPCSNAVSAATSTTRSGCTRTTSTSLLPQ